MVCNIRIIYVILSIVFGFIAGMHITFTYKSATLIPTILICFIPGYVFSSNFKKVIVIAVFICLGGILGLIYSTKLKNDEVYKFRCRKNIELILYIDSISSKLDGNTVYGYATIISAPSNLLAILKQKAYFILKYDKIIPCLGQKVKVVCKLTHITDKDKSSFSQFLCKNHIFLYCSDGSIVDILGEASYFKKFCSTYRERIFSYLKCGVANSTLNGVLVAMLTGNKSGVDKKLRDDFCDAGVAHVFAVSGLHIGLIAAFLDWLLRMFLLPKKIRAFPLLGLLFIYLNIIGPMPSSVRAYMMISFYYLAVLFNRQPNVLSTYTNSLLIYVLCSPTIAYNISFLLSYCVVFGIIVIGTPLTQSCECFFRKKQLKKFSALNIFQKFTIKLRGYLLSSSCTSLAACLSSLIISVEFFGQISLLTIIFNILIIPLASLSIILGSLSIICGILHATFLCTYVNYLALLPITLIRGCFNITRSFNHGLIHISLPINGLWLVSLLVIACIGWKLITNHNSYVSSIDEHVLF